MVIIKKQLVKRTNKISTGTNLLNYITIHETANTNRGANAQSHANLQSNGNPRDASWHYQVDDKQAIQSFPDSARCWHAGIGNSRSIAVEICVNSDGNFKQAVANAVDLVQTLMRRHNISHTNVVQHNKWTGKNCPTFLRNGAKGYYWSDFKSMITGAIAKPAAVNNLVLQYGDGGERVRLYQDKLKRAGYAIAVDGSFGPAMTGVVKQFQRDNGLAVDGYLGPLTQKKINEVLIAEREGELTVSQYNELLKKIQNLEGQLNSSRGVSTSFTDDWDWAERKGFLDGSNPGRYVTREQLAAVINRVNESNDLTATAKKDFEKGLKDAYEMGIFMEDHSADVATMPEYKVVNLLVSLVARIIKRQKEQEEKEREQEID